MLDFCEALYGFRFATDEITEQVRQHIRLLLRRALQHYEEEEQWEKLFLLMRVAPSSPLMRDIELRRLRHIARAYELRRITRNRRWLYSYLTLQAALVVFVFPYLFINAENGEIQRQVENLTDVEVGDEGYRLFSYADGLYWSVITAAVHRLWRHHALHEHRAHHRRRARRHGRVPDGADGRNLPAAGRAVKLDLRVASLCGEVPGTSSELGFC